MTMRKAWIPLLFLLLILTLVSIGPETPADDPAPAPQTGEEPTAGEPPETFVPSEKLPADSAVSFPVDI